MTGWKRTIRPRIRIYFLIIVMPSRFIRRAGWAVFFSYLIQCPPDRLMSLSIADRRRAGWHGFGPWCFSLFNAMSAGPRYRYSRSCISLFFPIILLCVRINERADRLAPASTTGPHRLAKNNVQFFYSTAVGNVIVAYKREAFMKV